MSAIKRGELAVWFLFVWVLGWSVWLLSSFLDDDSDTPDDVTHVIDHEWSGTKGNEDVGN